ncbi:TPA: restriction endonuclease subunit S [Streptococcus suis]|nr:restriction endonuclease subunit S [Streptococcus suis]HEM3658601.1 restriction endonuclease subunit S [Streptococcus suis]
MVDDRKVPEGYKVTEVGVIPDEWEISEWGQVLQGFSSGATPYRAISSYYDGEINWVTSGELKQKEIYKTIEHISEEALLKTNLKIHPPGTFLMAITGLEAAGTRGSCGIIQIDSTTNQSCMAIYGTDRIDVNYLYYYYDMHGDELAFKYCQGTKQQSYTAKIVKKLPILYPNDINEQKAIAEALSDTDNLILSLEKLIDKKKKIKQGAMQQLLNGKKRLPGFSGEWEVRNFQQLGYFISGNGFPIKYQSNKTGKYPFYKVSDFNNIGNDVFMIKANNYIEEDTRKAISAKIIPAYAVIFAKIGAAIFLERKRISSVECCIDNNMMSFVSNADLLFSKLAYYLFKNIQLSNLVSATALPSLSAKDIGKLEICIPEDLEEQKAIAQVLSDMDLEIEALEEKLEKYKTIKQGMMQELLTGRIRLI